MNFDLQIKVNVLAQDGNRLAMADQLRRIALAVEEGLMSGMTPMLQGQKACGSWVITEVKEETI